MNSRLLLLFIVFFDSYIAPSFGDDDDYVVDEYAEQRARAQALHDKALELAIAGRELGRCGFLYLKNNV